MSIRISPQALTGVIWPKKPFMHPDGLLVEAGFELSSTVFTCVAFTPDDPLRFCASDSTGAVHLFQLKKNRVSTVARCTSAVSSVVFGKNRSTIHISSGMTVNTVNIDACRVDSKVKSPHKNNIVALTSPNLMAGDGTSSPGVGGVYATMFGSLSSDSLTLWTSSSGTGTVAGSGVAELSTPLPDCRVETRGKFTSFSMSTTHVYAIDATEQTVSCFSTKRLSLVARVSLQPHVPYTLSLAASFLAVGARNSPNLLLLKPVSLEGISRVVLPSQPDSPSTLHVSTVAAADPTGRLVGCQLSDGNVWFVSTQTYGATFSLTPSAGDVPLQLSLAAEEYGVALSAGTLKVYHLPAAKQYFDRTHSKKNPTTLSESVASATAKPFLKTANEKEEVAPERERDPQVEAGDATDQVNVTAGGRTHKGIARSVLSCEKSSRRSADAASGEGGQRDLAWVRVNLIDRTRELKALATEVQPKLLSDAIKTSFLPASSAPSSDGAAAGQTSAAGKQGKASTLKKPTTSTAAGSAQVPNKVISEGGVPGVSLRALLDDDSKVLNLEKLRVILMKYGCYPDRYRALIWRFLLQLPEKALIAPQFANLSSKGLHPGVHAMMKHYPLPDSKQKIHLERALSALAYHAPVFSVVDWLPCIVFPFVKAFGADTQSAVEVCIAFFLNWGQEFFVYYPHPPVQISSYISHLLKAEDPQLWQHFQEIACSPEDYVFSVLQPVFSEVLTRNEWLQLMDHAFSNEPLWLFLFHVRWLCDIRELLLSIQDHAELVALLHRTIPCDFNRIIQQTYRLHGRCLRNELTEPYHNLITFDETGYPTTIVANDAVITSKVRELEKIEDHEKEVVAMKSRTQMIEKQLAQAAMLEDAYISKQKALVAAKFDASNSLWQQQVALEKERQHLRDIEQTSRLHAVQEQLRSAHRLQSVQDEIRAANSTIKDAEVDRQRESMKWDFADRMTHQEMSRIENAAKSKLSTVLNVAKEETLAERDLRHALEDNRGLVLSDYVAAGADSQNLSAVSNGQENQHRHQGPGLTAAGPPEPFAVPPVPQAAIPVATTRSGSSQGLSPSQSPETHHAQAEGQNNRVAPRGYPAPHEAVVQAVRGNSPPTATTSQPTSSSPSHREGSSTTDTSAPPSSANSDPIAYYRRLQQQVREKVKEAHAEQRAAISTLNSSYARKLMAEVVQQSTTSGSTPDRAVEGGTLSGEEGHDVSGTTVTEGDLSDHEEHEEVEEGSHLVHRGRADTGVRWGQERESANSSTDASSIHHAITRPQPAAFFRIPPSEAETHSTE